jgi:hypothetical protein
MASTGPVRRIVGWRRRWLRTASPLALLVATMAMAGAGG